MNCNQTYKYVITFCISTFILTTLSAGSFKKEINEIKLGKRQAARASWWGFDKNNATHCLQQAIDSGVTKLIIDNTGSEWLVSPINLRSNQEIIIEKGTVVRALPGSYKGGNDCLFTAIKKKNITIRGEQNAIIKMNKKDYQNRNFYSKAEWRHAIKISASENIVIRDLTILQSGGDGIYITGVKGKEYSKDILIENVISKDNHRQGLSVISVENLLVKDSIFSDTSGTNPASGIDFEPNYPKHRLVNCVVENTIMSGNAGAGADVCPTMLDATSLPVSITFRNCKFIKNRYGLKMLMRNKTSPVLGKVEFIDCKVAGNWLRTSWINDAGPAFKVVFKNTILDNRSASANSAVILTSIIHSETTTLGNIYFDNVKILDKNGRLPVGLVKRPGVAFDDNIVGTITLNGKKFNFNSFIKKKIKELRAMKSLTPAKLNIDALQSPNVSKIKPLKPARINLRYHVSMLLQGRAGEEVKLTIVPRKYGSRTNNIQLNLYDPKLKKIKSCNLKANSKVYLLKFVPKISGVYKLNVHTGGQLVTIDTNNVGQGITPLIDGRIHIVAPRGKLYFQVPADQRNIKLLICGDPNEYITASLRNASGKAVQTHNHFVKNTLFSVIRRVNAPAEIWSIDFKKATEDVHIQMIVPLQPVMSKRPQLMFRFRTQN